MKQLWPSYVLFSLFHGYLQLPWAEQGAAFHVTELTEEALQNNPRAA